jgi:hypothetical protein
MPDWTMKNPKAGYVRRYPSHWTLDDLRRSLIAAGYPEIAEQVGREPTLLGRPVSHIEPHLPEERDA